MRECLPDGQWSHRAPICGKETVGCHVFGWCKNGSCHLNYLSLAVCASTSIYSCECGVVPSGQSVVDFRFQRHHSSCQSVNWWRIGWFVFCHTAGKSALVVSRPAGYLRNIRRRDITVRCVLCLRKLNAQFMLITSLTCIALRNRIVLVFTPLCKYFGCKELSLVTNVPLWSSLGQFLFSHCALRLQVRTYWHYGSVFDVMIGSSTFLWHASSGTNPIVGAPTADYIRSLSSPITFFPISLFTNWLRYSSCVCAQ